MDEVEHKPRLVDIKTLDKEAWEAAEKRRSEESKHYSAEEAYKQTLSGAVGGAISAIKSPNPINILEHVLELATSVHALQRNHTSMEQAIAQAFGELTKGFRAEVDALAKAVGVDLPKVMRERMEAQQASQNTPAASPGTEIPQ